MPMNTVIRQRRLALGMTQEQVADRLGVTAPAVNKWEKGGTCPDVALLAPLARLLQADVNTLLCFREDLTEQELADFAKDMADTMEKDGFDAVYALAMEKLREYPACEQLTQNTAMFLDGALLTCGVAGPEKERYQREIEGLYRRLADSENPKIRDSAIYLLAGRVIQRGEYDQAERLLDRLPEGRGVDKQQLKACLLLKQGRGREAAELLERKCMCCANELQITLLNLLHAVQQEGDEQRAEQMAEIYGQCVDLLGLWAYGRCVAPMDVALARRDVPGSLQAMENLLSALLRPWDAGKSPLYRHMARQMKGNEAFGKQVLPSLLAELKADPRCEFLQAEPAFQALLDRYGALCP